MTNDQTRVSVSGLFDKFNEQISKRHKNALNISERNDGQWKNE